MDKLAWSLIEDVVQRDSGCDEEACIANIARSYFLRRGLADTLDAFDADRRENTHDEHVTPTMQLAESWDKFARIYRHTKDSTSPVPAAGSGAPNTDSAHRINVQSRQRDVRRRRDAQLLCLQERYDEVAAMMPTKSVVRLKLLYMAALHGHRSSAQAILFVATHVAPQVALCEDPQAAHELHLTFVSSLLFKDSCRDGGGDVKSCAIKSTALTQPPSVIAREVNEVLLHHKGPSALNVLVLWADWMNKCAQQTL